MAAQRYISTSFWDDAWIQGLPPEEKLIYMYLLTNALTNIAGVYEITLRRIAFDTGYPLDRVYKALNLFERDGKAYFFNESWIILTNWPKHQKVSERSKIRDGIDAILKALPDEVWSYLNSVKYEYQFIDEIGREIYPLHTPCIPLAYPSNYIESDIDIDIDLDKDNTLSGKPDGVVEKELPSDESKTKRGSEKIPYQEIVDYLNLRVGSNYRHQTADTRKLIKARWSNGHRLDDFKKVIDKKVVDSKTVRSDGQFVFDPRYLRPQTLFGSKFEGYLNQPDVVPTITKGQAERIDKMSDTMRVLERMRNERND